MQKSTIVGGNKVSWLDNGAMVAYDYLAGCWWEESGFPYPDSTWSRRNWVPR